MPISQYSLLSQQNEGNVRLFFFATMVTFLLPVILIVAGAQEPNKFVTYGFGIVAVVFFVLGVVWPPIRRFLEFRRYSVPMIPSGLAWFILIISMAGYTLFSGINSSIQISRLPVAAENYQGTPLGILWMTARLVATTPPLVFGFAVDAKNVGTEELALKDAYLISGIDSTKVSMLVSTPPMEAIPVTEASIPPNAPIAFTAPFKHSHVRLYK